MANHFIGFPVPRAKIAEMIEGGIEAAGGISIPWDDLYWELLFLSLDGFYCLDGGSGTYNLFEDGVCLHTGDTAGSYASLRKVIGHTWTALTWAKKRRIRFALYINSDADNVGDFYLCSGDVPTDRLIGFKVSAGVLYGIVRSNGAETLVNLKTLGASDYSTYLTLECRFFPGDRCDFYVDGVLEGTTGSNLPEGTTDAGEMISLKVQNVASANTKYMTIALFTFWQEA